jgi:hypothetical protein
MKLISQSCGDSEKEATRVVLWPDLIGALLVGGAHGITTRLVDVAVGLLFASGRLPCQIAVQQQHATESRL